MNQLMMKAIFNRLKIPENGRNYIERVRSSPPSRAVEAGAFNVVDRIASRKMGMIITSESRSAELPLILYCELNKSVLEFYDQPEEIKITYVKSDGKRRSDWITNDLLIIKETEIFLVECKKEEELKKLCITQPEKFVFDEKTSRYLCLPAIEACEKMGIKHRISIDKDFTATFIRNSLFLFNFLDDKKINMEEGDEISCFIKQHGNRIKLDELNKQFTQKKVIQAIFNSFIFVDIESQLLMQADKTWVYHSSSSMQGYANLHSSVDLIPVRLYSDLTNSSHVYIGEEKFEVISFDSDSLLIRNDKLINLSKTEVQYLIESEQLFIVDLTSALTKNTESLLDTYSATEIEGALKKLAELEKYKKGEPTSISKSTAKRWRKAFDKSKEEIGSGLIGLIEKHKNKGNRSARLGIANLTLIEKIMTDVIGKPSGPNLYSAFLTYINRCNTLGIAPASMTTFYNHSKAISEYKFVLKREGLKAAYALGPRPLNTDPKYDVSPIGDFIFQIAHIDHTPLELEFVSALNGEVFQLRVNLTLLKDSYSLKVLAVFLSFEKPSYRSCMLVLRECFRIYRRLPLWIMCDGAAEFKSVYFQETLANFGVNIRYRPSSAYRHGSPIERNFGISEQQFIHNLKGNRKLKKYGRGQSPSHDSSDFAIWTPDEFLISAKEYFYETHPNVSSSGIKETPQQRFNHNKSLFDDLPGVKLENESIFDFKTLPIYKKTITLNKNQLNFQKIGYRLTRTVPGYEFGKIKVKVKYDPYNCEAIYVELNNQWTKMTTQDPIVRACRDKGIILGFLEIHSRKLRHGRDYRKGSQALLVAEQKNSEKEERLFNQKNAIFSAEHLTLPAPVEDAPTTDFDFENLDVVHTTKLSTFSK